MKFCLKEQIKPSTPWNLIDNHLWSKCFSIQISREDQIFIPKGLVTTSTTSLAPGPSASFNISVPNVSEQAITNASATTQSITTNPALHLQLQGQTFQLVTPIKFQVLNKLLRDHSNRSKVDYVIKSFQFGFSLEYNGPLENRQPKNLLSAYQHADKLRSSLIKEVKLGDMLGPFPVQPLDPLICSQVGMVEKQDSQKMRHITHLSHPRGRSINAYIDPEDAQTHYQSVKVAVELVAGQAQDPSWPRRTSSQHFAMFPCDLQTYTCWE